MQQSQQHPVQSQQQQPDPMSSFDSDFEKDPVEAMKALGKNTISEIQRTRQQLAQDLQAQQAAAHYQRQLRENPDFAQLDPDMRQLAREYGSYLRPEVANSPAVIDLLHQLARSKNMNRYIDAAVEKAKAANNMVNAEKRAAFSESSTSTGSGRVNPEDLSDEELERLLGRK
jgi:hypothetical protein